MEILIQTLNMVKDLAKEQKWNVENIRVEVSIWENNQIAQLNTIVYFPGEINISATQDASKRLEITELILRAQYLNIQNHASNRIKKREFR